MSGTFFTGLIPLTFGIAFLIGTTVIVADESVFSLNKRRIVSDAKDSSDRVFETADWPAEQTAVIVCDVWDYHHSINAVRRIEEILPRLNALLKEARKRGAIIIHAPSDCMPEYAGHPARLSATNIAKTPLPDDIAAWCSRIPSEEQASYPIDQSDGGEDDDPSEHQRWAEKLKELGRNPAMPWKAQSPGIEIDGTKDYISDRGDEVWSILVDRKIRHVIVAGVHTNMCVLGRPFGLRQLSKQKMDVVLVRDLTDCMYNPKRWPFVDHFTGNDLIVSYIERFVCPTITSDQILGGQAIRFQGDSRRVSDVAAVSPKSNPDSKAITWSILNVPTGPSRSLSSSKRLWLRCAIRFPDGALDQPGTLQAIGPVEGAWINGKPLSTEKATDGITIFKLDKELTFGNDDPNLLVLCYDVQFDASIHGAPQVITGAGITVLSGKWQAAYQSWNSNAEDLSATNIPLPAKFALPPEIFHECRR